jgi:hypothetical protein
MKSVALSFSLVFTLFLVPQIASAIVVVNPKVEKLYGFDVQKLNLNATDILKLDAKIIEAKTGQKLTVKQKAALKVAKWQAQLMKKMGKSDAQIMSSIGKFKFDWLGFVLGVILGLIGVFIVYFFMDNKNAEISVLIGCCVFVAVAILIFYQMINRIYSYP